MNLARLRSLLHKVQTKKVTIEEALDRLRTLPYENRGDAHCPRCSRNLVRREAPPTGGDRPHGTSS